MPTRVSMSEDADIQWGTIKSFNKAKTFYSSFISEGVVYELFDNVEVFNDDDSDPYIGKIVRLWEEKASGTRKVLIRWFFKLKDLDREMEGDPRELYLAFGTGKGVTNENDLEVICGKCKVLCTSKDARNWQPSARDVRNADFFFSKIYNVDLQHLSPVQRIVDKLGCEAVYNKPEWVTEISKNKEKAIEQLNSVQDCKRVSTSKQEAQCIGNSPSDLKDRQRDSDAIIDTQQKACQGSDLKTQQTSMNEISQNKKLKTSATTSPSTKVATSNMIQESENISCLGEAAASKIPTDAIIDTQQNACLRQQTSSMNEVAQNKKLKTSATTSPSTKVAASNMIQESENVSCLGEAVASKISTDAIIDTQQKACLGSDLKRQQTSSMKKLKTSATTTKVATTNMIQNSENVSSLSEAVASKVPIMDTQKKARQGSDLKRQQTISMNEISQNKKLKTSATTSPSTKVATENTIQKSENVSSLVEAVASKVPTDAIIDTQQKARQGSDLKRQLSMNEVSQNRKLKTSATTSPSAKVATENTIQKSENVSSLGEAVASKVPTFGDYVGPSSKVEQEEHRKTDLPACVRPQTNLKTSNLERSLSFGKTLVSETTLLKVDDNSGQQAVATTVSSRQLDEKERADHNALKEACIDAQKIKEDITVGQTNSLTRAKTASGLLEEEAEKNWKIFKSLPWEQNLKQGIQYERVLLLQNLDPCLTTVDVCDMLKNILQGVSDARIIPQETTCPCGQALVIFDSRLLAESALQEMERKCLVVANNRRPIIASKFRETTNLSRFPGHLALEKLKQSRNLGADEYKKAVSTSHCSQPNTIEYEMAMEWRRLQEIIQTCRTELFERQTKEMEEIRKGASCGNI